MNTVTNYNTVIPEARELALNTINKHHIQDTKSGELGFWLGFDVKSDQIAIAMLIQEKLDSGKPFRDSLSVFVHIKTKVPNGVLRSEIQIPEKEPEETFRKPIYTNESEIITTFG